MHRVLAAVTGGAIVGLALFAIGLFAFMRGWPIFNLILERDPIQPV
ncbi:hypothetical protein [Mycolicibacterium fortuitum]|nr:hypothetical protein [Mycolicibacterium fortuitum]